MQKTSILLAPIFLCMASSRASAFPWPVEPRLPSTALATRQFQSQRIHSLAFDGSDQLIIALGNEFGFWKPSQPKDIKTVGRSDSELLQVSQTGNELRILTKHSYSIRKYESGSLTENPKSTFPVAEKFRFAAAVTNHRTVFWRSEGDPLFYTDAQAKPVAIKLGESKLAGLTISSNGRLLAVATAGGSVRVGNLLANGTFDLKCSKRLPRQEEMPLTFSPDGGLLAIGNGGRLMLMDTTTGQLVFAFERGFDDGDISTIKFSLNGSLIATGTKRPLPVVRVWHVATGKPLGDFPTFASSITALAFDSKGSKLASGDSSGRVIVWKHNQEPETEPTLSKNDAWEQLDSINPAEGRKAMRALIGSDAENPADNALDIHRRISMVDSDREELRKSIPLLDHNEYKVREAARRQLLKSGHRGMELLRESGRKKMGTEGEDQIRMILKSYEENGLHRPENEMYGDTLRILRAIQIIEALAQKDSRATLQYLIKKYPKSRIAKDAEAIMEIP